MFVHEISGRRVEGRGDGGLREEVTERGSEREQHRVDFVNLKEFKDFKIIKFLYLRACS